MKKMMALTLAMAFTAATIGVAHSLTCDVTAVTGTTVTLDCKQIAKSKVEVGKPVTVSPKKEKKVEGC